MDNIQDGTKSVRFPIATDEKLSKLSLKLGRSKKMIICQTVDYFYHTKKDPVDLNDELLKRQIASGISRIIAFSKQQEKDLIIPQYEILDRLDASINMVLDQSENFAEKLGQINELQQRYMKMFAEFSNSSLDKNTLKSRFKLIFESYISSRDKLGWNASATSKEEIRRNALEALFKL
ncbi:BfmA/BtgA family mobilization protein [Sphingobacterium sp. UBA6645]|uniref:BfmA/BtgA family mobilization protein n=1 Tax=Sphingobacterium sp. UBA6645 TaxID=1947511 RepID=UPI0025FD6B79|nr:BfmA/BtgA family mobilization protein [Sphingobacterium sp. UBA6645]